MPKEDMYVGQVLSRRTVLGRGDHDARTEGEAVSASDLTEAATLLPVLTSLSKATRALLSLGLATRGLSNGQDELVMLLSSSGRHTVSSLADRLCVRGATITKMVERLEARGIVSSRPDPEDRRYTLVGLTPSGLRAVGDVEAVRRSIEADLVSRLDAGRVAQMAVALETVDTHLQKLLSDSRR